MNVLNLNKLNIKFVSEDTFSCETLNESVQCGIDSEQKKLLEKFFVDFKRGYNNKSFECHLVLSELITQLSSKKSLRKYIYEQYLNKQFTQELNLFQYVFEKLFNNLIETLNQGNFNTLHYLNLLNFSFTYLQNFQTDVKNYKNFTKTTKQFYLLILQILAKEICSNDDILKNDEIFTILDYSLTHLLIILAKIKEAEVITYNLEFIICCHSILHCNTLKYETTVKCTLLMSYLLNCLKETDRNSFTYKFIPILDYLEKDEITIRNVPLSNIFNTNFMRIILYAAAVNSSTLAQLILVRIKNESAFAFLFSNLIQLGKESFCADTISIFHPENEYLRTSICPDQIILVAKTLSEMSAHLKLIKNIDLIFEEAMNFSWAHLEHYVENVVHSTKNLFGNLIESAKNTDKYLNELFQTLKSITRFNKVRLIALEIVCTKLEPETVLKNMENLQQDLISMILDADLGQLAGNCFIRLMLRHSSALDDEEFIKLWLRPAMHRIPSNSIDANTNVWQNIVTRAVQQRPSIFIKLFPATYIGDSPVENIIILRCINMARTKGIKLTTEKSGQAVDDAIWRNYLATRTLETFMVDQDEDLRLWALQVVVECQKSTEMFSEWELSYLLDYFTLNISTQIPSVRKKICTFYKKTCARFQASLNVILRQIDQAKRKGSDLAEFEQRQRYYENFLKKFLRTLIRNLSPDANHSRRSLSLELLLIIRDNRLVHHNWSEFFSNDDINNLKVVLNDSYENNKSMAVQILQLLPSERIGFENEKDTKMYFDQALKNACDIKPSRTLSASYEMQLLLQSKFPFGLDHNDSAKSDFRHFILEQLLDKINESHQQIKNELTNGYITFSFHGILLCIKTLITTRNFHDDNNQLYARLFKNLIDLNFNIKTTMMPIVSNAAPEGYIPDDSDFDMADQSSKSQMNLVCAWKTMKEIMLLFAEIVRQTICLQNHCRLIENETMLRIGNFFLDIFIQTKHRGVFEQAGVAFAVICQEFAKSKCSQINSLPMKWLDDAISLCTGRKTDERLCATRRSAGLPFLILSIVSTQAEINILYFQKTMEQLLHTSTNTDESNDELRTHCLNILRFMFLNSKLGDLVPSYIDQTSIVALIGFKSKSWRVRNASTLLYSALITRIFGVQRTSDSEHLSSKNRLTLTVFSMRYPKLFDFLLETLATECSKRNSIILHPVLLILARLDPSHNEKVNEQVGKHLGFINVCIAGCSFRTRNLAARASVSLIPSILVARHLNENFEKLANNRQLTDSACHGILLQISHLLRSLNRNGIFEPPPENLILKTLSLLNGKNSHSTVSTYFDVLYQLISKFKESIKKKKFPMLRTIVDSLISYKISELSTAKSTLKWNRFQLILAIYFQYPELEFYKTVWVVISHQILSFLFGDDLQTKRNCLILLIKFNQLRIQAKEHPLIESGNIQIPETIQELIENQIQHTDLKNFLDCPLIKKYIKYYFSEQFSIYRSSDNECITLNLILLSYYPSIYPSFNPHRFFILMSIYQTSKNEEIICSAISCVDTFIQHLDEECLRKLQCNYILDKLIQSASPACANFRRLSVAQLLVNSNMKILNVFNHRLQCYNIFNIILVLLEDEDKYIRNTMSGFLSTNNQFVIPYKIQESIFKLSLSKLQMNLAVCFLVSWSLRHLPEITADSSEVYDRSELNIYAENIPITTLACKELKTFFYSSANKSLDFVNMNLNISKTILTSLLDFPSPMMHKSTKDNVIKALSTICSHLENHSNIEQIELQRFFDEIIFKNFEKNLKYDYSSVKYFFTSIYNLQSCCN